MYNEFDYDDGVEEHGYVVTGCHDEDNFDAGFDDFPATEDNKTYLVERFVTYHNAISFVFGGSEPCLQWLAKQIGFDADHWSVGFVADELEELLK